MNGIRYSNMGDRNKVQEQLVANWQIALNKKLQKMVKNKYPGYNINIFGQSYIYMFFQV
jgi:hypothetical protein